MKKAHGNHFAINGRLLIIILAILTPTILFFTLTQSVNAQSGIIYVNHAASSGANNGQDWANAYLNLENALAVASSGDEIWVAKGIYTPGTQYYESFELVSGVSLFGGFIGTENMRTDRDWDQNVTILSGDIGRDDLTTTGIIDDRDNLVGINSTHVVVAKPTANNNISTSTILDGFTITGGTALGATFPSNGGGGFLCETNGVGTMCQPTISNVTFIGNYSAYGGGMLNVSHNGESSPNLTNVKFYRNEAFFGGGMYNFGNNGESKPNLTGVLFSENLAFSRGGGMYNNGENGVGNPHLSDVLFSNNSSVAGGGMFNDGANGVSSPILENVSFVNNHADGSGGGLYNFGNDGVSSPKLTNVTISGNRAKNGAGMYNDGKTGLSEPNLMFVEFIDNHLTSYGFGGGLHHVGSYSGDNHPILTNVTFDDNSANKGGGMYVNGYGNHDNYPIMTNVTFENNSAVDGGGLFNYRTVSIITNATFTNNNATYGGGIHNDGAPINLTNVQFNNNSAILGGGIANYARYSFMTNIVLQNNSASSGGGIYNINHNTTVTNATFIENEASFHGGGLFHEDGPLTMSDTTFQSNNAAIDGGGLYFYSTSPTLKNMTIVSNTASAGGGIFLWSNGTLNLTNAVISHNSVSGRGGGLVLYPGNHMLTNLTVANNTATYGGGMRLYGTPTLTNVKIVNNMALLNGGGIYYNDNGRLEFSNVLIANNSALDRGGGIFHYSGDPIYTNVTVVNNSAEFGGASWSNGANSTIRNSIFWNNEGSVELTGFYIDPSTAGDISVTNSLIEATGGSGTGWIGGEFTDNGGNIDANPNFVSLVNNNYRLSAGSPAIDSGDNSFVNVAQDLDGYARIQNGTVDMGAYELGTEPSSIQLSEQATSTPSTNIERSVVIILTFLILTSISLVVLRTSK